MTEDQLKKLRQYYHSLFGQQRFFEDKRNAVVKHPPIRVLTDEIKAIENDFPDLLPPFDPREFHSHDEFYNTSGVQAYLHTAIARLQIAIETNESTPVTETRDFSFVGDKQLRRVIERDYSEIQRAYIAKCWKSVIILCGGAIETILADILLQNPSQAVAASKAPNRPDITRWDLADLINVAVELKLVSPGIEKLSHSVREYRNLVHPGNEIRNNLAFGMEEARIALEVLHILHRDLSS